jgi:RNA polymerase-associated protein LEO1
MLVRAVGQKHNKVARLRMAPDPKMDPEREVAELMKVVAKKSKKKIEEDGLSGRRRKSGHSRKRAAELWSDDDEEPEDMGSEDEDDDRIGGLRKAKAKLDDDAKKRRREYEEDDFVVADSSDGGSEGGAKPGNRQRPTDEDVEEDPLDQMEAKLREQDREGRKKRHRMLSEVKDIDVGDVLENPGDNDAQGDSGEEMDVESEEVEEEIKVRRVGTGTRKKRAIDFEDEDEE